MKDNKQDVPKRTMFFIAFLIFLEAFCPASILQRVSAHTISRNVDTMFSIYFIDRFVFKPFKESDKNLCYPLTAEDEVIHVNASGDLIRCIEHQEFGTAFWNIRFCLTLPAAG